MRIAFVIGNDGSDVRTGKLCRSLSSMGHDVHLIGWGNQPDPARQIDLGLASVHTLSSTRNPGRIPPFGRLRFLWYAWRKLARLRPDVVWTVNEDNAFFLLPLKGLFFRSLVCDVYDGLTERHSHRSWPLRMILRVISSIGRAGADRLIATDAAREERFGRFRHKTAVVCNYPEHSGNGLWRKQPAGPTKVYVTGAIHSTRGLRQILDAAARAGNVEIVAAGWINDDYSADVFARHPKVSYRGVVTAKESLALAAECDAVLAFYEPISTNNRLASPNKIYDAMCVGRPVIVNTEARVSEWVTDRKLGFACAYDDVSSLTRILAGLLDCRRDLPHFAEYAKGVSAGYTWQQMEPRLREVCASLERVETVQPAVPATPIHPEFVPDVVSWRQTPVAVPPDGGLAPQQGPVLTPAHPSQPDGQASQRESFEPVAK